MSSNITRSQSVPHDLDTVKKSERSIIAKLPKEKAEQLRRRLFSDNALDYKESIGIGEERYVTCAKGMEKHVSISDYSLKTCNRLTKVLL